MIQRPSNPLSLIALIANSNPASLLFDNQLLQRGIHLRWSFDPDLGYPRNGFNVYRSSLDDNGRINAPTSVLFNWSFDMSLDSLFQTHTIPFPGYAGFLEQRYSGNNTIAQIYEHIQSLRPTEQEWVRRSNKFPQAEGKKIQIPVLDSILLAAADPNIARFAGLYFVDHQLLDSGEVLNRACYWVEGDWGAQSYPKKDIDLKNIPAQELGLSIRKPGIEIIAQGGYFINARVEPPATSRVAYDRLWFRGEPGRILTISSDEPVEEMILDGSFLEPGDIFTDGRQPAVIDRTGSEMTIISPGRPFFQLSISTTRTNGVYLEKVSLRRKTGPIGNLRSPVCYLAAVSLELPVGIFVAPRINMEEPVIEAATPVLNNNGYLELPKSQIVLPASYYNPSWTFPAKPLSLIFGKSPGEASQPLPDFTLNNRFDDADRGPALFRAQEEPLPDLAAWFKFDGNFEDAKSKQAATPIGKLRFAKANIGQERLQIDERYPHLQTVGKRVLCFDGNTALMLDRFQELKSPGNSFTISFRVLAGTMNKDTIRTLLGSDTGEGLFIGISSVADQRDELKLHLRINDTVVELPEWTFVNYWQNLALVVRNGRGQIFINFSPLGGTFVFPAAQLRFSDRNLYLGGIPGGPRDQNFRGFLADVQFWHRAVDPRTAALSLAQHSVALDQYLPLRPAFHLPETLSFNGQAPHRQFTQPDLQDLTSFSIQFWMRPEAGGYFLGFPGTNGFALRLNETDRRLHFVTRFDPETSIVSNWQYEREAWTQIGITYDCQQLKIFVDGRLDKSVNLFRRFNMADLSTVPDNGSIPAFRGRIADFRIYKLPLPPQTLKTRGPISSHPQILTFLPGDHPWQDLSYPLAPVLLTRQMGMFFWIHPENDPLPPGNHRPVLLFNSGINFITFLSPLKYRHEYYFGIRLASVTIGTERTTIQPDCWTHIGITWDAEKVCLFINGLLIETISENVPNQLLFNPANISIGNGIAGNPGYDAFQGQVTGFQIWNQAISPNELRFFSAPPFLVDRNVDDGDYTYYVRSTDLWGQLSGWSAPLSVQVQNRLTFNGPVDVKATFLPVAGEVIQTTALPEEDHTPKRYEAVIELQAPFLGDPRELRRYEALFSRPGQRATFSGGTEAYRLKQPFEVLLAERAGGRLLKLTLRDRPFAQLEPAINDQVSIAFDQEFVFSWAWTGVQQLHNPAVDRFLPHLRRGAWNEVVAPIYEVISHPERHYRLQTRIELPEEEFINAYAAVENRLYRIVEYARDHITLEAQGDFDMPPPRVGATLHINVPEISSIYADPLDKTQYIPLEPEITSVFRPWEPRQYELRNADMLTAEEIGRLRSDIAEADWQDRGLDWLPEKNVLRLELTGIRETPPANMPLNQAANAEESQYMRQHYVPGAVVAMCAVNEIWAYRIFYVFWHEVRRQPDGSLQWIGYLSAPEGEGPEELTGDTVSFAGRSPTRIYYGRKFQRRLSLPAGLLPDFSVAPTNEFSIAVEAATADGSIEGELSPKAAMIAADRRLAVPGPIPRILNIGKPGFDGQAACTVEWDVVPDALGYQLYRAVDTAIFERDQEQRRRREAGSDYAGGDIAGVFRDDPDFADWLRAYRHRRPEAALANLDGLFAPRLNPAWEAQDAFWREWAGLFYTGPEWAEQDWKADVIQRRRRAGPYAGMSYDQVLTDPPRHRGWVAARTGGQDPAGFFPPEINPAWLTAHEFWRAWADRFYPSLTDREVEDLANRPGNESAFTIVHNEPLNPPVTDERVIYTDPVSGTVSNGYLYRTRVLGRNLQAGAWSKASEPKALEKPASPPRAPVFTKVEAGDRQITLQWALNREPNLLGYTLYRAEDEALLADLRWADAAPIPGVTSIFIPDPRIVTRWDENGDAYILLPGDSPITRAEQILGIYRADEFDAGAERVEVQVGAMDYRLGVQTSVVILGDRTFRRVTGLRKVARGVEMAIVWRDIMDIKLLETRAIYLYTDINVVWGVNYYYKISSVAKNGFKSDSPKCILGKSLDDSIPISPEWISGTWVKYLNTGEILPFNTVSEGKSCIQLIWSEEPLGARIKIQKKNQLGVWIDITDWLYDVQHYLDLALETSDTFYDQTYRLLLLGTNNKSNQYFKELLIQKII